jgi:hypothetical protein
MPCSVGVVSSEPILRVDWDDRRGTSFMQQYTYRQLGLAEAADQLAGVMYLKSLPYIDRDRVGYDALISQQPSVVGLFSVSALNCFVLRGGRQNLGLELRWLHDHKSHGNGRSETQPKWEL